MEIARSGNKRYFDDSGKLIVQKTTDPTAALESAAALRSAGMTGFSEHKHVGRIDNHVLEMWVKEAGIDWSDHEALKDLIRRKMLDGDFAKFRVWEGTY